MDSRSTAPWEQQRRAPLRARDAEDGGGAAGPSTVEGKIEMVKIFLEMKRFSLLPHAGPGDAPKGASPGLGGGATAIFLLSFRIGKMLLSVNVCLKYPVFNASGAAVCRPQSVAGRWAGRRAERRVAWPWRKPECNFLSCFGRIVFGKMRCRGKTSVAMQCTASRLETLQTAPLKTPWTFFLCKHIG